MHANIGQSDMNCKKIVRRVSSFFVMFLPCKFAVHTQRNNGGGPSYFFCCRAMLFAFIANDIDNDAAFVSILLWQQ